MIIMYNIIISSSSGIIMPAQLFIPDNFYKEKQGGGYSATGPGDYVDPQRLVLGEPAWWSNQNGSGVEAGEPKVLIFADSTIAFHSYMTDVAKVYNFKETTETLYKLLMQGFTIKYCNTNNMMVDLTLEDFKQHDFLSSVHCKGYQYNDKNKYKVIENISAAISAAGMATEDCVFLDGRTLRQLRTRESLPENLAKGDISSVELYLNSDLELQSFFAQDDAVDEECDILSLCLNGQSSEQHTYSLQKLLSLLSGSNVRHLALSKLNFDKLDTPATTVALPNIKYLYLDFADKHEDSEKDRLLRLLSSMTQLEELYIKYPNLPELPPGLALSCLKVFYLSDAKHFKLNFLQQAARLESITLKGCNVTELVEPPHFSPLQYVKLERCKFPNAASVFALCQNAVKVEICGMELNTSPAKGLEDLQHFRSLIDLTITVSKQAEALLAEILIQKALNLTNLSVRLSPEVALPDSFCRLNLVNIEKVAIHGLHRSSLRGIPQIYPPIAVANIYYGAPKLKYLDLAYLTMVMPQGDGFADAKEAFEKIAKDSKLVAGARPLIRMDNCAVDLGFLYSLGNVAADYSCSNLTVSDNAMVDELPFIPGVIKSCCALTLNTLRAINISLLEKNSLVHLRSLDLKGLDFIGISDTKKTSVAELVAWLKKIFVAAPHIERIALPNLPVIKQKIAELSVQFLGLQCTVMYAPHIKPQPTLNDPYNHSPQDIYGGGGGAAKDTCETLTTADPLFDLENHLTQEPPKAFDRANRPHPTDQSQKMIIYKLSIYLLEVLNRPDLVAEIQAGICINLTSLFAKKTKQEWRDIVEGICRWDGSIATLDPKVAGYFENIVSVIDETKKKPMQGMYCGAQIQDAINSMEDNSSIIITNPWHAIAIRRSAESFYFYNPNASYGVVELDGIDVLLEMLQEQLGTLLSVARHGAGAMQPECITDLNEFLSSGGFVLLSENTSLLAYCENDFGYSYSDKALRGLLIFNADCIPAWLSGMQQSFCRKFFMQRMNDYVKSSAENITSLEQSLRNLAEDIKNLGLEIIAELRKETPRISVIDAAINSYNYAISVTKTPDIATGDLKDPSQSSATAAAAAAPNTFGRSGLFSVANDPAVRLEAHYLQEFQQARQSMPIFANQDDWMDALFAAESKNKLVVTTSAAAELVATTAIYEALSATFPVYLAKEPRDLFCNHPTIVRGADEVGLYREGSVGPLYDFITSVNAESQSPAFIVVYGKNFDKTAPFNCMFDDTPTVDGSALPSNVRIIWVKDASDLRNSLKPDFISRFGKTFNYNFAVTMPKVPAISAEEMADATVINLHGSSNWQGILDGSPIINGQEIKFTPSALADARAKGKPIVIANGPNDDPIFRLFAAQLAVDNARTADGATNIRHAIVPFVFTDFADSVSFKKIDADILFAPHDYHLLNLNTFSSMFSETVFSSDGLLTMQAGLLHRNQDKTLRLLLTSTLPEQNWAKLLTMARDVGVTLEIYVLPNISIPGRFVCDITAAPADVLGGGGGAAKAGDVDASQYFICSEDIGFSVANLLHTSADFGDAIILDVSGLERHHLLESIELAPGFSIKDGNLSFTRNEQYFLECLKNNPEQKFILHGKFSNGLLDALLPLLKLYPGRFVLISDDAKQFMKFSSDKINITYADRLALLSKILGQDVSPDLNKTDAEKFNLSYHELLALWLHQQQNPENTDCRAPWRSFMRLAIPTALHPVVVKSDEEHKQAADEYMTARVQMIEEALAHSPFVTILGLTGVGKSSLLRQVFKYETDILTWAENKSGGLLFIDEATIANSALSKYTWNMFAGMHAAQPYVVIAGRKVDITEKHKVIFAGNPLNYAGRELAELFIKYPNHIVFEPLSIDIIYDRILLPILSPLDAPSIKIAVEQILTAYNLFIKYATDSVLITARHLKTIAMLTFKDFYNDRNLDMVGVVQNNINLVLSNVVPEAARAEFAALFPAAKTANSSYVNLSGHIVAPSRQGPYQYCQSILALRTFMQDDDRRLNASQKKGGLGCIILEGGPGLGKTEMLRALMHANGLQEKHLNTASVASEDEDGQKYCCIPASLSPEMKNALYLQAYRNGWVVIADEFNSDAIPEQLLNRILDGSDADCKPGFLLFITQNPVILGNRVAISPALLNRANYNYVNDYAPDEIPVILQMLGVDEQRAKALARAFSQFNREHSDDPMTFRALMRMVSPTPDQEQAIVAATSPRP
jgi:hypothetical protein